jgi:lipoate-protein ligase A
MAVDQALLERAGRLGERRLRLYRWHPHCLSFGRHEQALRRYDRDRIVASGLDVVRRPTGGRAVWHAGELTYAVAMPAAELSCGDHTSRFTACCSTPRGRWGSMLASPEARARLRRLLRLAGR